MCAHVERIVLMEDVKVYMYTYSSHKFVEIVDILGMKIKEEKLQYGSSFRISVKRAKIDISRDSKQLF